ncbi:MAG: hypothetical protein HC860_02295 [Alkalinema sp. RU_4_3]|nr:hypothetical protein [Alkalinema sp. RU_4_3]
MTGAAIVPATQAQEGVVFRPRETVDNAMDRTFFRNSESIIDTNSSFKAVQSMIGTFKYPENAIAKDGKDVHGLYRYLLNRQSLDDPTIRTADLNNPFNLSVQTLPTYKPGMRSSGDFVFDRNPEATPPVAPPAMPAPMPTPMPTKPEPVEAKF